MTADSAKATGELIKSRIVMGVFRIVLGSARYGQTTSINAVVDLVAFDTVSPRTSSEAWPGLFEKNFGKLMPVILNRDGSALRRCGAESQSGFAFKL